jgi:hypothetical protein
LRNGTSPLRLPCGRARERGVPDNPQHLRCPPQSLIGEGNPGLGGSPVHFRLTHRPSSDSRPPPFSTRCTGKPASSTRPAISAALKSYRSRPQGSCRSIGRGWRMRSGPDVFPPDSESGCAPVDRVDLFGQDSGSLWNMSERLGCSLCAPSGRAVRTDGNVDHRRLGAFQVQRPTDR